MTRSLMDKLPALGSRLQTTGTQKGDNSMRTIPDESALEVPQPITVGAVVTREYLRSKSDPYALIACQTGEIYARQDGQRWEYPAYAVTLENDGVTVTREHRFAYCDSQVYAPAPSQSAA